MNRLPLTAFHAPHSTLTHLTRNGDYTLCGMRMNERWFHTTIADEQCFCTNCTNAIEANDDEGYDNYDDGYDDNIDAGVDQRGRARYGRR